ncbi:hypothetical protein BrevBR_04830 [Brevundimonas sp. BR2-1]|uniref:hypothetical protein n=1 Tax=Brevundimonas sp. BR2-1 TaxID=3031123 RepID=UPI0030A42FE6
MSRIVALGLTALTLAACNPADQAPPTTPPAATGAAPPSAPVSWEATQERYRQVEAAPSDPVEALEWRAVQCDHYSSEFGGDGSERDQWLNTQMDRLECEDGLAAEARAMRDARSGEPVVVARLTTVLAALGE